MGFEEILAETTASHVDERRWGKAIISATVALLIAGVGAGAKITSDTYVAHEAQEVAAAQRLSAERQATCHEIFAYAGDETPNKQMDSQVQSKIGTVVARGMEQCAIALSPPSATLPVKGKPVQAEQK